MGRKAWQRYNPGLFFLPLIVSLFVFEQHWNNLQAVKNRPHFIISAEALKSALPQQNRYAAPIFDTVFNSGIF